MPEIDVTVDGKTVGSVVKDGVLRNPFTSVDIPSSPKLSTRRNVMEGTLELHAKLPSTDPNPLSQTGPELRP